MDVVRAPERVGDDQDPDDGGTERDQQDAHSPGTLTLKCAGGGVTEQLTHAQDITGP
jgi:hypothetical protein